MASGPGAMAFGTGWGYMPGKSTLPVTSPQVAAAANAIPPGVDQDIEERGSAENAWRAQGGQFFAAGPAQQFHQQQGGQFLAPDANAQAWAAHQAQPMGNNALTEYRGFNGRRPNIATEPGFGSYYDNAQRNVVNELNTQLGARGAYGSSVGLGQIGKSVTDLRADQAKNEADYNLKRLAEQRNWTELGGTLARNADLSGQGNLDATGRLANNASTSRAENLRNAGVVANAAGTERARGLEGGMSAAGLAQTAKENRVGMGWDMTKAATGIMQSIFGDNYDKLLAGDLSLLDAEMAAKVGQLRDAANVSSQAGTRNDNFATALLAALFG